MRAAVVPKVGGKWEVREIPTPEPSANQVLIKIHASGLCYTDVHITEGRLPIPIEFPLTLGHEPVGEIVAVGRRCDFAQGRRQSRSSLDSNIMWKV